MINMQIVRENVPLELREQLARLPPLLRRECGQELLNSRRINFRADRPVLNLGEMLDQQIDYAIAEAAHLFARQRNSRTLS